MSLKLLRLLCAAILLALMLGGSSCNLTDPQINARTEIRQILEDIEHYFNYKEILPIMNLVHPNYLHEGITVWQFRQIWENRMASFVLMEIRDLNITFTGDYATAAMKLSFIDPGGSMSYFEPETNGDISYFYYDGYRWRLCGKDFYQH